jgi:Cu-processing system permease protein
MKSITKIIMLDNLKSKIVIGYFLMLALISWTSLLLEDNEAKGTLTLLNIVLFVVPLMSLLYSTVYLYNSKDFVVLLLSQPLRRSQIWHSLFAGVGGGLTVAFLAATGIPLLLYTGIGTALMMILLGVVMTVIFTALAFLTATLSSDKTRGIGAAIILWLFFTMIYDAVLMYLIMIFSDYPIEMPISALLMLNPLDLARFQIILKMDATAMMGYSGASFLHFLGERLGILLSAALLILWVVAPYLLSLRIFKRKDL